MNLFSASSSIQRFCDNGGTVRTTMMTTLTTTATIPYRSKNNGVRFNCRYYRQNAILQRKSIAFYGAIFISLIFQYCRRFACCYLSIVDSWQIGGFSMRRRCCCVFLCDHCYLRLVSNIRSFVVFPYDQYSNTQYIFFYLSKQTVTVGIILLCASLISLLA